MSQVKEFPVTGAGSMTKAELVEEVSRVSDLTKKHSEVIVDTVFKRHHRRVHRGRRSNCGGSAASGCAAANRARAESETGDKVDVPPKKVP